MKANNTQVGWFCFESNYLNGKKLHFMAAGSLNGRFLLGSMHIMKNEEDIWKRTFIDIAGSLTVKRSD